MKCKKCGVNKLSKEFPPFVFTEYCKHPRLHCLRCVTSYWEVHKQCSQCNVDVDDSSPNIINCQYLLDKMFPEIKQEQQEDILDHTTSITLTRINGQSFDEPYSESMTIAELKQKVSERMRVPPEKQSLLYNGQKLKELDEIHVVANTIKSCAVQPMSTIYVMVLLYAVPSNLNEVVFDLYWGFPFSGRDYLDASAWTFEGQKFVECVRFYDKEAHAGAIRHSGDRVDHIMKEGHQLINVDLHEIPSNITHIFFTLSSYSSRTISHFRNPSVKLYDAAKPDCMLVEDKTKSAGHRQAIVMCSLQKIKKKWFVISNGALSDGHAKNNLEPLLETIQEIIAKTGPYVHVLLKIVYSKITDPEKLALVLARGK